ncbi:metal-dependent hydrolase [Salinadaptatus halalkaliphilus]|uniref:Metal-dependent hydrolase n=1 Tax=Salinadaptatus halalkaliphilus TaxID=2419781 RepID=A0A4S3TLZ2_9EURY|nr:metal-dependent hydrolase [Salinadaptatus halalkaliphilus]THE65224.1 metal-dependent hydrolase [Salinadaptatus halalkaliphilus]
MPSTVVHAGFALLLAAGLLKGAYDRRTLAILLVVVTLPEADTLVGPWMDGAHRALLHNLTIPILAGIVVYWDTCYRERSWLRERFGGGGIRVAWVVLFVHVFAHILLDYAHLEGINVFYPVYDRFFRLEGELLVSTADGVIQTFVEFETNPETGEQTADVGAVGTTADTHVANPVELSEDPEPDDPILLPIAERGWELYLALTGLFVLIARRLQNRDSE